MLYKLKIRTGMHIVLATPAAALTLRSRVGRRNATTRCRA
ncbi:hypothetical protein SAMN05216189_1012160 [Pseudomonas delhiensis]|uniref:Uncharacterized protein n=1 Tax=Pseudomonas delhiensis TaxID=366289 RepID=A0A239G2K0_9PSED|nr:hypothetical protein SAMN05216189_1012160 [Pseudomonas delhiensis]SNS62938.1 hypothetical protein SAMN06295949_104183 [Pseudomonas delhiensis]